MNRKSLDKVVAFVVSGSSLWLLVFEHPTAGCQLPKGTVEPGETLEEGVRREIFEETGVELSGGGEVLGAEQRTLEDGRGVMLRTTTTDGETFRRGRFVDVLGTSHEPGCIAVREQHFDYRESPPAVIRSQVGVVPYERVGRLVRRTFFLFRVERESRETWTREADGHVFEARWADVHGLELHGRQQAWLEQFGPDIVAAVSSR